MGDIIASRPFESAHECTGRDQNMKKEEDSFDEDGIRFVYKIQLRGDPLMSN